MTNAPAAPPDPAPVRTDEELALDVAFWRIVCAEDDWLRAELDALTADACSAPDRCGGTGRRPSARRPGPPSRGSGLAAEGVRPPRPTAPVRQRARQRSPPARAGTERGT